MVEIAKYPDLLSFLEKMFHVKRPSYANIVQENETRSGSAKHRLLASLRRRRFLGQCRAGRSQSDCVVDQRCDLAGGLGNRNPATMDV